MGSTRERPAKTSREKFEEAVAGLNVSFKEPLHASCGEVRLIRKWNGLLTLKGMFVVEKVAI